MSAITFDTLKFVERLEKAGASRELASAMAQAQKESLAEVMDSNIATRGDIAQVRSDILKLEHHVDSLAAELRAEMRSNELRLTVKLGAFMVASVGATVALLKLL